MTTNYIHPLLREPETLTALDLIFRPGFIKIMSIIWTPLMVIIIIILLVRYNKNKTNNTKKILKKEDSIA